MEIEENSILDDYHKEDKDKKEAVSAGGQEDDYTNPEEISSGGNKAAVDVISELDPSGYTKISNFQQESSNHFISLGIELSKNHPVLKNTQFIGDIQEKLKGL